MFLAKEIISIPVTTLGPLLSLLITGLQTAPKRLSCDQAGAGTGVLLVAPGILIFYDLFRANTKPQGADISSDITQILSRLPCSFRKPCFSPAKPFQPIFPCIVNILSRCTQFQEIPLQNSQVKNH
jgi:hypothetical protein